MFAHGLEIGANREAMMKLFREKVPIIIALSISGTILLLLAIYNISRELITFSLLPTISAILLGAIFGTFVAIFEYFIYKRNSLSRFRPKSTPIIVLYLIFFLGLLLIDTIPITYLWEVLATYLYILAIFLGVYEKATNQKWLTFARLYDRTKSIDNKKPED